MQKSTRPQIRLVSSHEPHGWRLGRLLAKALRKDQEVAEPHGAIPVQIESCLKPRVAPAQPELCRKQQKVRKTHLSIGVKVGRASSRGGMRRHVPQLYSLRPSCTGTAFYHQRKTTHAYAHPTTPGGWRDGPASTRPTTWLYRRPIRTRVSSHPVKTRRTTPTDNLKEC